MLVYLSDVEEGGETSFLLEGKDGLKRLSSIDYKSCSTGIKYKPRAGDALLFWSMYPDHTVDKHSLHGGCPVVSKIVFLLIFFWLFTAFFPIIFCLCVRTTIWMID